MGRLGSKKRRAMSADLAATQFSTLIVAAVSAYLFAVHRRGTAIWVWLRLSVVRSSPTSSRERSIDPGRMSFLTPSGCLHRAFLADMLPYRRSPYLSLAALLASEDLSYGMKTYFMSLELLLTIAVGLSRVYLGIHYPTDVFAGWCVGSAWAIFLLACLVVAQEPRRDRVSSMKVIVVVNAAAGSTKSQRRGSARVVRWRRLSSDVALRAELRFVEGDQIAAVAKQALADAAWGAVDAIVVRGEPDVVGTCHCTECRKATGGAFLSYADWPRAAFSSTGEAREFAGRSFCPNCGSRLFHLSTDKVEIMLGALDDAPSDLRPTREGWTKRREHWLTPIQDAGQYS